MCKIYKIVEYKSCKIYKNPFYIDMKKHGLYNLGSK